MNNLICFILYSHLNNFEIFRVCNTCGLYIWNEFGKFKLNNQTFQRVCLLARDSLVQVYKINVAFFSPIIIIKPPGSPFDILKIKLKCWRPIMCIWSLMKDKDRLIIYNQKLLLPNNFWNINSEAFTQHETSALLVNMLFL